MATCETCRFWEKPNGLFPVFHERNHREGICRNPMNDKFSWTVIQNRPVRVASLVDPLDGCDEHQPKDNPND